MILYVKHEFYTRVIETIYQYDLIKKNDFHFPKVLKFVVVGTKRPMETSHTHFSRDLRFNVKCLLAE
jgi:hypothetical protein